MSTLRLVIICICVMAPIMAILAWCLVRDNRVENARQRERERQNDEMWERIYTATSSIEAATSSIEEVDKGK